MDNNKQGMVINKEWTITNRVINKEWTITNRVINMDNGNQQGMNNNKQW